MANKGFRLLSDGDPETGMQPSNFTSPEAFTSDDRREVNHFFFAAADESILCGVWETRPARRSLRATRSMK
jgi:hypothetical protein